MSEIEGVVKYNLEFEKKELDLENEYKNLENLRERLYALGLIGAYEDGLGYGNLSLRLKDSKEFLITATQTGHLKNLQLKDYSVVKKIDFKSFKTTAFGLCKPSSECITHGAIYNLDKNINAVIHIHNEKLWNFMLKNDYLSTNDTPYGTPEMVEDIIHMYKDINILKNNLFVMKGHFEGIVCFGKTLEEAELTLYSLTKQLL